MGVSVWVVEREIVYLCRSDMAIPTVMFFTVSYVICYVTFKLY